MFVCGPDLRCGSNAELLHVCIIAQHHLAFTWSHPISNSVFLCTYLQMNCRRKVTNKRCLRHPFWGGKAADDLCSNEASAERRRSQHVYAKTRFGLANGRYRLEVLALVTLQVERTSAHLIQPNRKGHLLSPRGPGPLESPLRSCSDQPIHTGQIDFKFVFALQSRLVQSSHARCPTSISQRQHDLKCESQRPRSRSA